MIFTNCHLLGQLFSTFWYINPLYSSDNVTNAQFMYNSTKKESIIVRY